MNAFSDIIIRRFDVNKNERDGIKTRIVYAPKQRVLNDILNKDQNLQLPVVAVSIGGIARDENRVFNKIQGTYYTPANGSYSVHERGVLPIDITYNVSVMTRFQQDMDQILSHIIPYINPYFIVSWRTPSRPDHEIRSKVLWGGNASVQYPLDLNANQAAKVTADLSFTFQGWLFQQSEIVPNIYTFNNSLVHGGLADYENLLSTSKQTLTSLNTIAVDSFKYTAIPPQPKFVEPVAIKANTIQNVTVWGNGLDSTLNVYLSGAPVAAASTLQNPFSASSMLSVINPSFNGYKIPNNKWSVNKTTNSVTFTVDPASIITVPGRLEIIVENNNGYGKLTHFAPRNIHSSIQVPYLQGLEVF
jgi:hypothetical protein